jgi:hypothetical protein
MDMKFALIPYADISTAYITESDQKLISSVDTPNHVAEHDDGYASFFYPPHNDSNAISLFAEEARDFGFSERFIEIMIELGRQGVQYVRFDSSGGDIDGIDPIETAEAVTDPQGA